MSKITLETRAKDRFDNGGIINFLRFVNVTTAGAAGGMIMSDHVMVRPDCVDEFPFHTLHVINVVKQLDSFAADLTTNFR